MNQRRSFYRKVGYAVAIAVLLIPLSMLSRPAISSKSSPDNKGDAGGILAQLRTEHKLSQTNLGEIDPASETMKFATLGLRGVASTLLWQKANDYKLKEDWANFETTLDQLIKLQPNYISVWQHQAWNVTYNLSVEFDDYRDRFYYVMRGIDFLEEGIKYNEEHPVLLSDLGWFVGQKIGRADEHTEYRRLFREDNDYHKDRVGQERDNWLVSREWYLRAHRAVEVLGKPLKTAKGKDKGELLFFNHAPMCLMNYGEAIEEEGTFGDLVKRTWDLAGERWYLDKDPNPAYGNRLIKHSTGMQFHLNDLDEVGVLVDKLTAALEALSPGLEDVIREELRSKLPKDQLAALDTPPLKRTEEQAALAANAESAIFVSHLDVARRIQQDNPQDKQKGDEAVRLARAAGEAETRGHRIESYREIVNFRFWKTRTQFEKTENALAARKLTIDADKAREEALFEKAKELYEESFASWQAVFDEFPEVATHGVTGDDVLDVIGRYRKLVTGEMDQEFPDDFILWHIIEYHDQGGDYRDLLDARRAKQADESKNDKPNETNEEPSEKKAAADRSLESDESKPREPEAEPAKSDSAKSDAGKSKDDPNRF